MRTFTCHGAWSILVLTEPTLDRKAKVLLIVGERGPTVIAPVLLKAELKTVATLESLLVEFNGLDGVTPPVLLYRLRFSNEEVYFGVIGPSCGLDPVSFAELHNSASLSVGLIRIETSILTSVGNRVGFA